MIIDRLVLKLKSFPGRRLPTKPTSVHSYKTRTGSRSPSTIAPKPYPAISNIEKITNNSAFFTAALDKMMHQCSSIPESIEDEGMSQ